VVELDTFFPPFPSLLSFSLLSQPLKSSKGVSGSALSSLGEVWGGAPAEIEFAAFKP